MSYRTLHHLALAVAIVLGAPLAGVAGCASGSRPTESSLGTGGGGASTSTDHGGGGANSAGGGGGSPGCTTPADCPDPGTVCKIAVCDKDETCSTKNAPSDTPCHEGHGKLCDDGACVECIDVDVDCPAATGECVTPTCDGGACGSDPVADGTATASGQIDGDCKIQVCDGAGDTRVDDDDADPQDDGNDCTIDTCAAGTNVHTAAAAGAACANLGGKVCGSGTKLGVCVHCLVDGDCTGGQICDTANDNFVCVSPTCQDGAKNGQETDVDCGGPNCGHCADGQSCLVANDCVSHLCRTNVCSACNVDGDCAAAEYCETATGDCKPDHPNGGACTSDAMCTSGHCADGVCCDTACSGTCSACSAAKKGQGVDGTCGPVALGQDPDSECPVDTIASCGSTGTCDGGGACRLYASGTVCVAAGCVGGVQSSADTCDGVGHCVDGGSTGCGAYQCNAGGTGCLTSCTVDTQCASGNYCNGTMCVPKLGNGTACSTANQCVAGFCVDGVCCNAACTGTCQACNIAAGTCQNVPNGQPDPGTCVGSSVCNGAGSCLLANGSGCSSPVNCVSGFCIDNVCCSSSCTGLCRACTAAKNGGTDGTCGNVVAGTDPDGECAGAYACTAAATCQSCTDAAKDGAETDIDCGGGGTCGTCANGRVCAVGTDCTSGFCNPTTLHCAAPTCSDGFKNGTEPDVDCGSLCPKCADLKACNVNADCLSNNCVGGICRAVSCLDGLKNGAETDIDCGGGSCPDCPNGGHCLVNGDCLSNLCQGGFCVPQAICGNGAIESGETCDDSNVVANDGCSPTCTCETARVKTLSGLGLAVADNTYNGTLASMSCVNVAMPVVTGCPATVTSTRLTLGMSHTWVGDLVVKIVAPDNTIVTVMNRPGLAESADDGVECCGFPANLITSSTVVFNQAAAVSAENMGSTLGDGQVVCQDDGICNYFPARGAAPGGDLNTFNGKTIAGTWRVCVGDAGAGDVGFIDRVTLRIGN